MVKDADAGWRDIPDVLAAADEDVGLHIEASCGEGQRDYIASATGAASASRAASIASTSAMIVSA